MRMTRLVISFNRHFFGIAIVSCFIGISLMLILENAVVWWLLAVGVALAIWFMAASIVASYFVYDASDLYKLQWWPARAFPEPPANGVLVHAGFDPASAAIRRRYPVMELRVFDFFDAQTTTEASIQRAHELVSPSASQEAIPFDSWPVPDRSQDAVFALSAVHELRAAEQRTALFAEAKRVLTPNGRIVVIEQLRDAANFACFGFAAFHFLSRNTWLRSFRSADLTVVDEFRISPFMTAFVVAPLTEPLSQAA